MTEPRCDKCEHFLVCKSCLEDEKVFHICDILLNEPDGYALVVYADDKCEMFTEREE